MTAQRSARSFVAIGGIILFSLALLLYALSKASTLIAGPTVSFASPQNGERYTAPYTAVVGEAHNISYLTLNGRQIYVDERGIFREKLLLPEGYTILELVGTDRFGRTAKRRVEVIYQ